MMYMEIMMNTEKMHLTHKIALCPTPEQVDYFQRACGTDHDRDLNAALNLSRLATETALPVASPSGNGGTAAEEVSAVVGKVTPVRYEVGPQGASGQEKNRAHNRALS